MSDSTDYETPSPLWMSIWYRDSNASHNGAPPHGIGHFFSTPSRIPCTIRQMGHKQWFKSIWEKVEKFKITIENALLPIDPL
jgi:hypothetical protein